MTLKKSYKLNLYVALAHYPVTNKNGETIASAITNLDLHDIARASKTFGVETFYVVTPLADQKKIAESVIGHWQTGYGSTYNPERKKALDLVVVKETLDDAIKDIKDTTGEKPVIIVTSAKNTENSLDFKTCKKMLETGKPYLLVFGTAWGLADEITDNADFTLRPIKGNSNYNHLSVRSAVSIILDRLIGIN